MNREEAFHVETARWMAFRRLILAGLTPAHSMVAYSDGSTQPRAALLFGDRELPRVQAAIRTVLIALGEEPGRITTGFRVFGNALGSHARNREDKSKGETA